MTMTKSEAGRLGRQSQNAQIAEAKLIRVQNYTANPIKCHTCGVPLVYEKRFNRFCSRSCAAKTNNLGVSRKRREKPNCSFCGAKLGLHALKYCSPSCQKAMLNKKGLEKLQRGELSTHVSIKKYLIQERGHRCEICHGERWMDEEIPLVLDHIDGHHENQRLDNLRLICGNCDMQTDTYKSKNKGNGRHKRRMRYQEGKSY